MTDAEMRAILERGMTAAAQELVRRVEEGTCSAADIAQLRAMFKDCGGSLTFGGRVSPVGDSVLESLANIDPDMLN
jgi:hypothetical protein